MASLAWFFDGTYSRKQLRQLVGALVGGKTAARPLGGYSGLTSPVTLSVTTTTWTVGAFTGVLDLESDATMGPSLVEHDGGTGSVTAASASFDRYDLLSLTTVDATATLPTLVYTAGTVATTLPATPANSIPFAQITVPKSGTGSPTVALIAPQAAAAGGIVPVSGTNAKPAAPRVGQYVDDPAVGLLRWGGASWGPPQIDTGFVTTGISPLGANTLSGAFMRRQGSLVQFQVVVTLSAFYATALSSGPTGNITNTAIATVTDSRFIPAHQADTLTCGATGSLLAASVDTTGQVLVNATVPNLTFAAGNGVSIAGMYFAD
jgi:hypothetical protein